MQGKKLKQKQANMVWVGQPGYRPVVLRPGFQSKKWLLAVFFSTMLAGRHSAQETTTTQEHCWQKLWRPWTYSICRKSMGAAVQEQRPDNGTVTRTLSLLMLLPTESKGHNLIQYDKEEKLEVFTNQGLDYDILPRTTAIGLRWCSLNGSKS